MPRTINPDTTANEQPMKNTQRTHWKTTMNDGSGEIKIVHEDNRPDFPDPLVIALVNPNLGNESEDNARLLAAAPELLAACEAIMRAEGLQQGERNGYIMGTISQAIDKARAAISKATGEGVA